MAIMDESEFMADAPQAGGTPVSSSNPAPVAPQIVSSDEFMSGGPDLSTPSFIPMVPQVTAAIKKPAEDVMKLGSQAANQMSHDWDTARYKLERRDWDVNYKSGTDFEDEVKLQESSNDRERRLYLDKKYGAQNVGQDPGGRFYIIRDGKKVAAGTPGFWSTLGGSVVSSGPEILASGGAGLAAGPYGVLPAMAAAAVGGIGGKAITEAKKAVEGRYDKSGLELAKELGISGVLGGVGEGVGQVGAKTAGALFRGGAPRWITGATPETEELVRQSLREGVAPPIKSAFPSAKTAQFHETLSEKLVGPWGENKKISALEGRLKSALAESGVQDTDAALKEILSTQRMSDADLGEKLGSRVRAYVDGLNEAAETGTKQAQKLIDDDIARIDKMLAVREESPSLHDAVANGIIETRRDFGTAASKLYNAVDRMVGDRQLVPASGIKMQAVRLLEQLPEAADGATGAMNGRIVSDPQLFGVMNDLFKARDMLTFGQAQQIRSKLADAAMSGDLTRGAVERQYGLLRDSVNRAFDIASRNPEAAPAVRMLKTADRFYADNIAKFDDAVLKKIIKDSKRGLGEGDAGTVANMLVRRGFTNRTREILDMMPQTVRREVALADYNNIKSAVTNPDGTLNPVKFHQMLENRGPVLENLYGPKIAKDMRLTADRLLAMNEKIPVENLTPDNFRATLEGIETAKKTADKFMDENYLRQLARPGTEQERAVDWLLEPGRGSRLKAAEKFFGNSSPEMLALRETALKRVLQEAMDRSETGANIKISGSGLNKAIDRFTAEQKKILFGEGMADDLKEVAKLANFWFPDKGSDMAAGLASGTIKMAMPASLPAYGYSAFWGWLLSRPWTIKYLALGNRGDGPIARQAAAIARASWEEFSQTSAFTPYKETHDRPGKPN